MQDGHCIDFHGALHLSCMSPAVFTYHDVQGLFPQVLLLFGAAATASASFGAVFTVVFACCRCSGAGAASIALFLLPVPVLVLVPLLLLYFGCRGLGLVLVQACASPTYTCVA